MQMPSGRRGSGFAGTSPLPTGAEFPNEAAMRAPLEAWCRFQGLFMRWELPLPWGVCDVVGVRFRERSAKRRLACGQLSPLVSMDLVRLLNLIPDLTSRQAVTLKRLQTLQANSRLPSQVLSDVEWLTKRRFVYSPRKNQVQKLVPWIPLHRKIIAVEMKLRRVSAAIAQARPHLAFADESYIALPENLAAQVSAGRRRAEFLRCGVGLLAVSSRGVRRLVVSRRQVGGAEPSGVLQTYCAERFWKMWLTDSAT